MATPEYSRLTPVRGAISRSSLWLGRDHVLCVQNMFFSERYRRFYFGDIQAFTLRRNNRALILGLVTGIPALFFLVLAVSSSANDDQFAFSIFTGVFIVPFVINLLYGPTCTCELRTAVHKEKLPSMSRVRRAHKVLARLRPLIAAAQGQLTPQEVALRFQGPSTPTTEAPPVMPTPGATPEAPP